MNKEREERQWLRKSTEEEQKEMNEMTDEFGIELNTRQRATLIESGHRINEVMGYDIKI